MFQNVQIKINYFIEEGLSCVSIVMAMKKEVGCGFNIMTATTNWIYAILRVMSKLVIIWVAQT